MNLRCIASFSFLFLLTPTTLLANVSLNNLFGDHMVLQQGIQNKIWGKADPGEKIAVSIAGQSHATVAKKDGAWSVQLDAIMAVSYTHLTLPTKRIV